MNTTPKTSNLSETTLTRSSVFFCREARRLLHLGYSFSQAETFRVQGAEQAMLDVWVHGVMGRLVERSGWDGGEAGVGG